MISGRGCYSWCYFLWESRRMGCFCSTRDDYGCIFLYDSGVWLKMIKQGVIGSCWNNTHPIFPTRASLWCRVLTFFWGHSWNIDFPYSHRTALSEILTSKKYHLSHIREYRCYALKSPNNDIPFWDHIPIWTMSKSSDRHSPLMDTLFEYIFCEYRFFFIYMRIALMMVCICSYALYYRDISDIWARAYHLHTDRNSTICKHIYPWYIPHTLSERITYNKTPIKY